jgi:hypothetical protein
MANSKLLGIEPLNPQAPGHDDALLGPSDSSDSGSDLTGLDTPDPGEPPLTRAASDAVQTPAGAGDDGSDTAEDESADPVGDGQSDAALAARLPPRQG